MSEPYDAIPGSVDLGSLQSSANTGAYPPPQGPYPPVQDYDPGYAAQQGSYPTAQYPQQQYQQPYGQAYGQPYPPQGYPQQGYPPQYGQQPQPQPYPQAFGQVYPQQYGQPYPPVMVAPKSPGLAVLASFFIPGLGSMISGRGGTGALILGLYVVSWFLIIVVVGIFGVFGCWIWGMVQGYSDAVAWNRSHGIIS